MLPEPPPSVTGLSRSTGARRKRSVPWQTFAVPDQAAQEFMDDLVGSVVPPGGEVVVRRVLLRQVVLEVGPLAAGPPLVEDRVHDLPHAVGALMTADRAVPVLPRGDHRLDQRPLLVR